MSLSASDAKNQVIERGTTENVDVIGSIGPTARVEAVGFVRHFVGDDGDVGGVVTFDFPAFVAHVAGAEEVDGAVAFAEDYAVVDLAVGGGDGGVCGCVVLGSCFYFLFLVGDLRGNYVRQKRKSHTDHYSSVVLGVHFFSIVVCSLGWLSNAVEAENLHIWCNG